MTLIVEEPIQSFLGEAEERGTIEESVLESFAAEHDLDEDELTALKAELEAREVDVATPAREPAETHVLSGSTDALTLFMTGAGRYPLLTASEEVRACGSRAETRPRRSAHNPTRLVIPIAKRYQGHDVPRRDLVQGVIGLNCAVKLRGSARGSRRTPPADPAGLSARDLEPVGHDPLPSPSTSAGLAGTACRAS